MKTKIRRLISISLTLVMVFAMVTANSLAVNAETSTSMNCVSYDGTNIGKYDYSYFYANTIKSYLTNVGNGQTMRVQGGIKDEGILVEYYDSSYNIVKRKIIKTELPVFGAFYASANNYFIITGQNNPKADDSVEVYRVTKFDKSWNKLGSDSLYGANTTIPFDAGSARIAECGDYIIIRTCHEMYSGHQANVTIQFCKSTAKITDSFTGVLNSSYGYISHSFNQFVQVENNKLVALDHGDYYPRSVVLQEYNTNLTTGKFVSQTSNTDVITFPYYSNYNYTGATLGGFEISDSSYLVAGSIVNDLTNPKQGPWNIFVSSVSRADHSVTMNKITNYDAGTYVSNPHFVKISSNNYLLMWADDNGIKYTKINRYGNKVGTTYSMAGNLSDCVPVVINNKLVWYTWDNGKIVFYNINLNNLADTSSVTKNFGHNYVYVGMNPDGTHTDLQCKACGEKITKYAPTSLKVFWATADKGVTPTYYSTAIPTINDSVSLHYLFQYTPSDALSAFDVTVSDESVAKVKKRSNTTGEIVLLKHGKFTVTFRSTYNPNVAYSRTFTLPHNFVNGKCSCGEKEYPFGDANMDGSLTITDATTVQLYLVGLADLSSRQMELADITQDGKVDIRDATYIQMKIAR